jgi:hypothetical protein
MCKNCNLNEIGDEYHFFLKCTANHSHSTKKIHNILLMVEALINIIIIILYLHNNTPMWVKQIQIQTKHRKHIVYDSSVRLSTIPL